MGSAAVIQPVVEVIQTKDGLVEGPFRHILSSMRLVVCLADHVGCPKGSLAMSNVDLARRSPKRTTHAVYAGGLYELKRALLHIRNQSGLSARLRSGKVQELSNVIRDCQDRAHALLRFNLLTEDEERAMDDQLKRLLGHLQHGRNVHLVEAFLLLKKSRKQRDSMGRKNPPAAAMRVGASIGHQKDRQQEIVRIMHWMDARIPAVVAEIETEMELFRYLRKQCEPLPKDASPRAISEAVFRNQFEALLSPTCRRGMIDLEDALVKLAFKFGMVDVLPFSRDAEVIAGLLRQMAREVEDGSRKGAHQYLKIIRQQFTRVFARHKLEFDLIGNLSFLLNEIDVRKLARKRRLRSATTTERDREFFLPRFEQLKLTLDDFSRRLQKCSDDALADDLKYKQKVTDLIHRAVDRAQVNDWAGVKTLLKRASTYL